MLFTKNLSNVVLGSPVEGTDEFIIISGWLGPLQIDKAVNLNSGAKIKAIYGMSAASGVSGPTHANLTVLDRSNPNLEIYYALPGNYFHSKIYVWKSKGEIIKALIGSANFTYPGLNTPYKDTLISIEPEDFHLLNSYIKIVFDSSRVERCLSPKLKTRISSIPRTVILDPKQLIIKSVGGRVITIRLTLLDRSGKVPTKSGLNWGQGKGHVKPNDSYIKISKAAVKTGFFKLKASKQVPIDVIWDDGTAMNCLEEGNQIYNGILYPKQIASADKKEILGLYLRKRLGVPKGQSVTMTDLRRYGKTYIDVTKTTSNSYYMDFSKPPRR